VLLVTNVPLFFCLQLNGDATYYDLQVQCLKGGGVLYRDMIEPNFPGIVWVHGFVRAVAGSSSLALRVFDLVVLTGIVGALAFWNRAAGRKIAGMATACLAAAVFLFYFSLTAWSHCQRDVWMLLPALLAAYLRHRNASWDRRSTTAWQFGLVCLLEGILWGGAFWIKPHIAVPAALVLLRSLASCRWSRSAWASVGCVVLGGVLAGVVGSLWLIRSGAWPYFWEMQLHWNPEYVAAKAKMNLARAHWDVLVGLTPWSWAHLVALPYAATRLMGWRPPFIGLPRDVTADRREGLLCALYVGWVAQTLALQHPFPYVHAPGVILAVALLSQVSWKAEASRVWRIAVASVFCAALLTSPATRIERLACWKGCVTRGPAPALRGRLQVESVPYWKYYPAILEFLRGKDVQGKDVLVYSSNLVTLYQDLGLTPPNRFVLTDAHVAFFSSRKAEIHAAIRKSQHRYVVSELIASGLRHDDLQYNNPRTGLPKAFPSQKLGLYPATQPVVFRSGWFVVHEACGEMGPFFARSH
jgi:hypothetical protein